MRGQTKMPEPLGAVRPRPGVHEGQQVATEQPPAPIDSNFRSVATSIDALDNALNEFLDRLSPLYVNQPETKGETGNGQIGKQSPGTSKYAVQLIEINNRVEDMRRKLSHATTRLEV